MLNIGITGGIGSGKTTVCQIFELLGIPVYYADERAKALMTSDKILKASVKQIFGDQAYFKNGRLNRKHIAAIAFNDKKKLEQLNQVVHPAVFRDSEQWISQQKAPYTLKEAALLFESGSYKSLDKIITVTAPKELRIKRVIKRDKTTRAAVIARMNKQWPEEKKVEMADFVINNDGNSSLILQILQIHQKLIQLNTSK